MHIATPQRVASEDQLVSAHMHAQYRLWVHNIQLDSSSTFHPVSRLHKPLLILGPILLVGGVVLLALSTVAVTSLVTRSINDDELSVYLEPGDHELYASNFQPRWHPVMIKIWDPWGHLMYEGPYVSHTDFTVVTEGIHRVEVTNVYDNNGVLELNRVGYPYQSLSSLGLVVLMVGIGSIVVGIIKPYQAHT